MIRHTLGFALFMAAIAALPVSAETAARFGLDGGITGNLFNDSTNITDAYTSPCLEFRYYPSPSLEFAASAAYTAYRRTTDLGSLTAGGGITYIGAGTRSPLSVYLAGAASTRIYGPLYDIYNHTDGSLAAQLRLRLSSRVSAAAGTAIIAAAYPNATEGDNLGRAIFGRLNIIPFGVNTVDLEAGIDHFTFPNLAATAQPQSGNAGVAAQLLTGLATVYYSARFSRPLGDHTGISINYGVRVFRDAEGMAALDLSLHDLSPWTAFREGHTIAADIKTFLVPHMVIAGGIEYHDMDYMDAFERLLASGTETYDVKSRSDRRTACTLDLRRPVVVSGGWILNPSLTLYYIENSSSDPLYTYISFGAAVSVNLSM